MLTWFFYQKDQIENIYNVIDYTVFKLSTYHNLKKYE